MARAKQIVIDLRQSKLFSVSCKCLEMLENLRYRGYKVNIIAKNWDTNNTKSGLTYNPNTKTYRKGESKFLWDPSVHPKDFYENLIVPTFSNLTYIKNEKKQTSINKLISMLNNLFDPYYFSELNFIPLYAERLEKKRYFQQHVDCFSKKPNLYNLIIFVISFLSLKYFNKLKIYSDSRGFRYKLNPLLIDDKVQRFIENAKKKCKKYVLIASNWDDSKKYEQQEDRLRGILSNDLEFKSMIEYIKDLDEYAKEGKIRFVLASKKAVDWPKIIESDFLDLREFEKNGFTLSQTIYIIQEITDMTLNWPNTFCIWMTNCTGMLHLTWCDNKDTAKWARNDLHKQPVQNALRLIDVK